MLRLENFQKLIDCGDCWFVTLPDLVVLLDFVGFIRSRGPGCSYQRHQEFCDAL